MLDKKSKAEMIAREVVAMIGTPKDYWSTVTIGEAMLILQEITESEKYFRMAIESNPKQFGKFQSTFAQLKFLQQSLTPQSMKLMRHLICLEYD